MMPASLFAITVDIPFGELLRQHLEETGLFLVSVVSDKRTALANAIQEKPPLAFIDTGLGEENILDICSSLRRVNPEIDFIIVSEEEKYLPLNELSPVDYLSKPYYLPDLLEMMDKMFPSRPTDTLPASSSSPTDEKFPWLFDVNRAAQHLTRLTLGSSAQAALITHNDELWAYAGQLPQSATRELADTVARYWDRQEENDLVRFVRLASTEAEHMLYATRLAAGMVLALIFDAETPFSTIRSQAGQLVRSLADTPAEKARELEEMDASPDYSSISDILSDIPSPNPEISSTENNPFKETDPAVPVPPASLPQFSYESSPSIPVRSMLSAEQEEAPLTDLEQTVRSATRKSRPRNVESLSDEFSVTRPSSITEAARKIVLEPTTPSVYNLDYACLLIPRFTQHHLTGDLSERLGGWVPQICIAFGWRLEYISVRPEYLQCIVNVPPASSPGYLMRMLRQHTSENIFDDFPRYKKENPSGDFWAPGYLIMGGSQPPPAQLVKDFIAQTRQRQGYSQPINR
jgi:REP element-mobilizing transposase RayT